FNYLLLIPFIIVPILITNNFFDSTLLIKRTSVFILYTLILLFFIIKRVNYNKITQLSIKWILSSLFLVVFLYITSFNNSLNFNESQWGIMYLVSWISITIIFTLYSNDKVMILLFLTTSVVGGTISLVSLLDYYNFFNLKLISFSTGTFGNRNYWGMYLCFVIPSTIFSSIIVTSKKYSLFHLSMFLISFSSLLHTRSRAAWLGIFVAFIFITIFFYKEIILWIRSLNIKVISIMILILVSLFILLFYQSDKNPNEKFPDFKVSIISTILSIKDIKNKDLWGSRIPMYSGTMDMIKDNILFGIGYENWRFQYPKYSGHLLNDSNYLKIVQRPHNDLLWMLSEVGLFGLLLYLIIFSFIIFHSFKLFLSLNRQKDSNKFLIFGFIFSCIIAIFIESLFDFPRQRTIPNLYLWSFWGYLLIKIPSKEIKKNYINTIIKVILVSILGLSVFFSLNDVRSNIYSQKLLFLKDTKQYNEALEYGEKIISLGKNVDNTGTPIYFYMGISEYENKNILTSETYFNKSLNISPYHLGSLENYMINTAKNKKINISLETLEFSKYIYPCYYNNRISMIKLYLQNNNFIDALKIISNINKDIKNNKRLDRYDSVDKIIKERLKNEMDKFSNYINKKTH
ncbi:O-antigen ligase family protein, partial [Candidatus Marinimicrobia bacterium]|nr:O-antigen ligase family protein [Candidatus Neomarinimicrobiota bacterium]